MIATLFLIVQWTDEAEKTPGGSGAKKVSTTVDESRFQIRIQQPESKIRGKKLRICRTRNLTEATLCHPSQ